MVKQAQFIRAPNANKPIHLELQKNLAKTIKLGHPWVFADSLAKVPPAPPGSLALLKTKNGQIIAKGFYTSKSPLAFKSLALVNERCDDALIQRRLERSWRLREGLFDKATTNAYRLINGEGDGLPGLVCDIYKDTAVIKLDGASAEGFYSVEAVAEWLMTRPHSPIRTVYQRFKDTSESRGQLLAGDLPGLVQILENGALFQVDVIHGQKTGFFLDQRDNRACVGKLCQTGFPLESSYSRGLRCLNICGYTGGFSVYAGRARTSNSVTTVDVAEKALEVADANWALNGLNPNAHESVHADAFKFLEDAVKQKDKWDLVIVDPPSFAPNQASVEKAKASYRGLFIHAAQCVIPNGMLALSSCSSHINAAMFNEVCCNALAAAQRPGYALTIAGQPEDHPTPIFAEELRYLKFNCYQLES